MKAVRCRASCIAIGWVWVWVSCSVSEHQDSPDFPNVLLISVDTLRADHVGLYGYERDTTPEIDAFFADATLYERAISPAPCTVPAVRQVLSGGFDVAPSRRRLPEILQSHGFRTLASVSQHQFLYDHEVGAYARGFDTFEAQSIAERDRYRMTTRTAEEVTTRGLDLLESWPWQRAPFFLWLHYFDPHDPYEPPAEYRSLDRGNSSARSGDRRAYLLRAGGSQKWMSAGKIFSEEDVAHFRNLHDGEIQYMDAELGRIFRALEQDDLVGHTIVVLISDHGEWLGEDDQWDHCRTLNQKELHVPFLIRALGGKVDGQGRESRVASTLDVLPTVLALLQIPMPDAGYAGHNLRLPPEPGRRVVSSWNREVAVQDERWKLIVGKSPALYDLSSDPEEQHNVVALHPLQVKRLGEEIGAREDVLRATATQHETIVEQLRAIGYIEE